MLRSAVGAFETLSLFGPEYLCSPSLYSEVGFRTLEQHDRVFRRYINFLEDLTQDSCTGAGGRYPCAGSPRRSACNGGGFCSSLSNCVFDRLTESIPSSASFSSDEAAVKSALRTFCHAPEAINSSVDFVVESRARARGGSHSPSTTSSAPAGPGAGGSRSTSPPATPGRGFGSLPSSPASRLFFHPDEHQRKETENVERHWVAASFLREHALWQRLFVGGKSGLEMEGGSTSFGELVSQSFIAPRAPGEGAASAAGLGSWSPLSLAEAEALAFASSGHSGREMRMEDQILSESQLQQGAAGLGGTTGVLAASSADVSSRMSLSTGSRSSVSGTGGFRSNQIHTAFETIVRWLIESVEVRLQSSAAALATLSRRYRQQFLSFGIPNTFSEAMQLHAEFGGTDDDPAVENKSAFDDLDEAFFTFVWKHKSALDAMIVPEREFRMLTSGEQGPPGLVQCDELLDRNGAAKTPELHDHAEDAEIEGARDLPPLALSGAGARKHLLSICETNVEECLKKSSISQLFRSYEEADHDLEGERDVLAENQRLLHRAATPNMIAGQDEDATEEQQVQEQLPHRSGSGEDEGAWSSSRPPPAFLSCCSSAASCRTTLKPSGSPLALNCSKSLVRAPSPVVEVSLASTFSPIVIETAQYTWLRYAVFAATRMAKHESGVEGADESLSRQRLGVVQMWYDMLSLGQMRIIGQTPRLQVEVDFLAFANWKTTSSPSHTRRSVDDYPSPTRGGQWAGDDDAHPGACSLVGATMGCGGTGRFEYDFRGLTKAAKLAQLFAEVVDLVPGNSAPTKSYHFNRCSSKRLVLGRTMVVPADQHHAHAHAGGAGGAMALRVAAVNLERVVQLKHYWAGAAADITIGKTSRIGTIFRHQGGRIKDADDNENDNDNKFEKLLSDHFLHGLLEWRKCACGHCATPTRTRTSTRTTSSPSSRQA